MPVLLCICVAAGIFGTLAVVLRVVAIYVFLLIGFRILGKRELAELSTFDFVILMLIPETVSASIVGEDHSLGAGIAAAATLMALVFIVSVVSHRFERMERAIDGRATILVRDGQMLEREMNLERVSPPELHAAMHRQGIERLDQVKLAILETGGDITFVKRESVA